MKHLISISCLLVSMSLSPMVPGAEAATAFGARLDHEPTPAETCHQGRPSNMCSWVMTIAQGAPTALKAPKTGTIAKLSLRSCSAGSFVLQVARLSSTGQSAKVIKTGPTINYKGSRTNCDGGNVIESFTVSVPITKGDVLSVVATKVGFIYNSSGDGTLVFDPPLVDGGAFRTTPGTGLGSGLLLLRATYTN